MKQTSISELRSNLTNLLKELPIEIIDGKSKKTLGFIVATDSSPVVAVLTERLTKAVSVFKEQKKQIDELSLKVAELEASKGSLALGIGGEVKGNDALLAFLDKTKKKAEQNLGRCQAPFCKADADAIADYYVFEDGALKMLPKQRLCKKHLKQSGDNSPTDRGDTTVIPE